jgi:hypothetical protein
VLVRLTPDLFLEGDGVKARDRPEDRDELKFRALCCREAPERLPLKLCALALLRVRANARCGVRTVRAEVEAGDVRAERARLRAAELELRDTFVRGALTLRLRLVRPAMGPFTVPVFAGLLRTREEPRRERPWMDPRCPAAVLRFEFRRERELRTRLGEVETRGDGSRGEPAHAVLH